MMAGYREASDQEEVTTMNGEEQQEEEQDDEDEATTEEVAMERARIPQLLEATESIPSPDSSENEDAGYENIYLELKNRIAKPP